MTRIATKFAAGSLGYRMVYDSHVAVLTEEDHRIASAAMAAFLRSRLLERFPPQPGARGPLSISLREAQHFLGLHQHVTVSDLIRHGTGAGPDTQAAFARKFFDGDETRLKLAAAKWGREHPEAFSLTPHARPVDRRFRDVQNFAKQGGVAAAIRKYSDITTFDVLRLAANPPRHGKDPAKADEIHLYIEQLRGGVIPGGSDEPASDIEKAARARRAAAKRG